MMREFARAAVAATVFLLGAHAAHAQMSVTSAEVQDGATMTNEQVGNQFGCGGGNKSPSLTWSGAPKDTKSFAVIMHDPDAPGGGFTHWVAFNIPATVTTLPKGAGGGIDKGLPEGARQTRNDAGGSGYFGPCPPSGKPHRYVITVYAVKDAELPLPADKAPTAAAVKDALRAGTLEKAVMTPVFGR